MGLRRILYVGARAAPFAAVPGTARWGETTFIAADGDIAAALGGALPFAAIVLDADDGAGALASLRAALAFDYPAPLVVLLPPGAAGTAREALRAGAAACVVRNGDYAEQLGWTIDAAIERHRLQEEHRRRGDALAESARQRHLLAERLHATLQHLQEGVLIVDARARTIVAANTAIERLLGTAFAIGERFADRAIAQWRDRVGNAVAPQDTPIWRTLADGQARLGEHLIIEQPDGMRRTVRISAVPLRDDSGALVGALGIFQELTDQARAELVRDEVLSIASHELRTPLTVVLGYSSLLRTLPSVVAEPRVQRAVGKMYEQSLRMRDLIDQLLDFSRLTLGRLQLHWIEFDLNSLVREIGEQQRAEAHPRPLRLALPDEALAMTGDYMRLARTLQQVVRAAWQDARGETVIALRTGPAGAFSAVGVPLPPDDARRYALISIGRTGSAPVATKDAGRDREIGPDGAVANPTHALELTISAELLRLHGGALVTEHRAEEGDAFGLLLPLREGAPA